MNSKSGIALNRLGVHGRVGWLAGLSVVVA